MKDYLKGLPWFLAAVIVAVAVGYLIERWRRRELRKWAEEQGSSLVSNGILGSVEIPESKPFDVGYETPQYDNVTRIVRPEATYILCEFYNSYLDTKNSQKSSSYVICYVVLPVEMPSVGVYPPVDFFGWKITLKKDHPTPHALPEFNAAFKASTLEGDPDPAPEALARLLPPEVQRELLANETLICGIRARGKVVRVQAVSQMAGYPHAKVFEVARRMAAAWK